MENSDWIAAMKHSDWIAALHGVCAKTAIGSLRLCVCVCVRKQRLDRYVAVCSEWFTCSSCFACSCLIHKSSVFIAAMLRLPTREEIEWMMAQAFPPGTIYVGEHYRVWYLWDGSDRWRVPGHWTGWHWEGTEASKQWWFTYGTNVHHPSIRNVLSATEPLRPQP